MIKNLDKLKSKSETELYPLMKIKMAIGNILSDIVEGELLIAYGDIWSKMASVTPPLTVDESISCIQRYWVAVFSFNLLKQCKQCIDEFQLLLSRLKNSKYF